MKRVKQQSGYIFKRAGKWILRYRVTINQGGELETVQKAKILAAVCPEYKTKASVRDLAKDFLATVNEYRTEPETVVTIGDFVKTVYLPFIKQQKRPSTEKGYRDAWEGHLKNRCGSTLLRDVRTCNVQKWLEAIAAEDKTEDKTPLSHRTLKHIKSLISGIFSHAKRQGFFDGVNPVQDTAIPPAPKPAETYAYSLEEITAMLMVLPEPAATVVATAAFTGARRGELRGMRWETYHDGAIYVDSSIWKSHVTEPKTNASKAPIPIISQLAAMLSNHRLRSGNPISGPIFPASNAKPFDPNNLLGRVILPVLNRCAKCSKPEGEHNAETDHKYERNRVLPEWHGWHAFRRGLATNLNHLGVPGKTIQAILRHANLATTENVYIKAVDADSVTAMQRLDGAISLLCSKRALFHSPSEKVYSA